MFPAVDQLTSLLYSITPAQMFELYAIVFCIGCIIYIMQTKRFYIVRHGQTLSNDAGVKQGAEGALNEAGKRQARAVGAALASISGRKIEAICSSPYERAKETAEIINSYLHVHISYTPLLTERRNPTEVIGKSVDDPEVHHITGLIEKGFHEDKYRFSDEENFVDLSRRARHCLSYLERRWSRQICVVTHHAFLHMFLSSLLYRNKLDAVNYAKLAFFNPADNAGITICEYNPWKRFNATHGWEILTYNQIADSSVA